MNSLARKVSSILPSLEGYGTVYLFALAEREDVNLWDIVLSSEWSDKDWSGSTRLVIDLLWPNLDSKEKSMIGRVAVVPSSDPRMQEERGSWDDVEPQDEKVIYVSFLGSEVRRAFVFKAQHAPPILTTEGMVDSVGVHA